MGRSKNMVSCYSHRHSPTGESAKEHSKINLKRVGKKAYQTSKESSNQNHKNVIMSLDKHLYLGI